MEVVLISLHSTYLDTNGVKVREGHLPCQIGPENAQPPEAKQVPLIYPLMQRVCSRMSLSTQSIANPHAGPQMSRNPSTNTILQVPKLSPSLPPPLVTEKHPSLAHPLKTRGGSLPYRSRSSERSRTADSKEKDLSSSSSSSSSSSDSDTAAPLSRSRAYMRRSRYPSSKPVLGPLSDADEDPEDSSPFLPFSDPKPFTPTPPPDPSATVQTTSKKLPSSKYVLGSPPKLDANPLIQTVHSSSSSAQSQAQSQAARPAQNPLSSLSPRQRRIAKEGSEGTPSMGSSFSDLDDASVTQSALEEALANEMNHGVASRMSTISQALRSRYL